MIECVQGEGSVFAVLVAVLLMCFPSCLTANFWVRCRFRIAMVYAAIEEGSSPSAFVVVSFLVVHLPDWRPHLHFGADMVQPRQEGYREKLDPEGPIIIERWIRLRHGDDVLPVKDTLVYSVDRVFPLVPPRPQTLKLQRLFP